MNANAKNPTSHKIYLKLCSIYVRNLFMSPCENNMYIYINYIIYVGKFNNHNKHIQYCAQSVYVIEKTFVYENGIFLIYIYMYANNKNQNRKFPISK